MILIFDQKPGWKGKRSNKNNIPTFERMFTSNLNSSQIQFDVKILFCLNLQVIFFLNLVSRNIFFNGNKKEFSGAQVPNFKRAPYFYLWIMEGSIDERNAWRIIRYPSLRHVISSIHWLPWSQQILRVASCWKPCIVFD